MTAGNRYLLALMILALGESLIAVEPRPTSSPAEWSPEVFAYDRPIRMDTRDSLTEIRRRVAGTKQRQIIFKDVRGDEVPVLITVPDKGPGPFPVIVLVHGFTSDKVQVTRQVGRALVDRGFACIAADMPMHGERPGIPKEMFPDDAPRKTFDNVVQAVIDIRQTIDLAAQSHELDTSDGVGLVGYSMGAWLGTLAGAADNRVRAMILMVGGAATTTTTGPPPNDARGVGVDRLDLLQRFTALRPNAAIGHFAPRPILMQNGKKDRLIPAERAKTLFRAAKSPKELRWYDSGHILPAEAYEYSADWLAEALKIEH